MLGAFRKRFAGALGYALDGAGFVASLTGASVSLHPTSGQTKNRGETP